MKYPKTALSFPGQADRLLARGLVADRAQLVERLSSVNYYRLSAYWYTFRIDDDSGDRLIPGTTLATVWSRYVFDRQLRLLVMDAIERVEVAIRTQIVNRHVLEHGPSGSGFVVEEFESGQEYLRASCPALEPCLRCSCSSARH